MYTLINQLNKETGNIAQVLLWQEYIPQLYSEKTTLGLVEAIQSIDGVWQAVYYADDVDLDNDEIDDKANKTFINFGTFSLMESLQELHDILSKTNYADDFKVDYS